METTTDIHPETRSDETVNGVAPAAGSAAGSAEELVVEELLVEEVSIDGMCGVY
ncbi:MAG: mycofactocin precursor MftA [Acidobacteria bacterium]|nr:mycofactocin precursor MftA [Acidobacteriota bacterium]